MSNYFFWNRKTIDNFSEVNVDTLYNQGYVFTRLGKGTMDQTRSLRIDLAKFELTSENRRILRKTEGLKISNFQLPISNYHWSIGKLAKDFYTEKFGNGVFSANKVKELLTSDTSNFNILLKYQINVSDTQDNRDTQDIQDIQDIGYCIGLQTKDFFHYTYPFYQLTNDKKQNNSSLISNFQFLISNIGMGMMLKAIVWTKEQKKKYVYLGSATRPIDVYKVQFDGLEWFDRERWNTGVNELKQILADHK